MKTEMSKQDLRIIKEKTMKITNTLNLILDLLVFVLTIMILALALKYEHNDVIFYILITFSTLSAIFIIVIFEKMRSDSEIVLNKLIQKHFQVTQHD